jgi:hypothetical protein
MVLNLTADRISAITWFGEPLLVDFGLLRTLPASPSATELAGTDVRRPEARADLDKGCERGRLWTDQEPSFGALGS